MYSFDLTAATDRFPLRLLFFVAEALWGTELASASVNSALATNIFDVPFRFSRNRKKKKIPEAVSFVVGQPLGYYSSWPLFSLAHHSLVWVAAEMEYPGRKFDRDALLGDDICIADTKVANRYKQLISDIGVKISLSKSLISHTGCAEFAKRFLVKGLSVDLSPLSFRAFLPYFHPFGFIALGMKYPMKDHILLRVGGSGYRCSTQAPRSARFRRAIVMLDRYRLPFLFWLGGGKPASPTQVGLAWFYTVKVTEPRCPTVPQKRIDEADARGGVFADAWYLTEHNWVRGNLKQWLSV